MNNIKRMAVFVLLSLPLLMFSLFATTPSDNSMAETVKKRSFDIESNVLKKCGHKCGAGCLHFVQAVGHGTYTSYIFICDNCFEHVEITPKGVDMTYWQ